KAGIIGFTRTLAKEVGSRGITINAIAPGFIDTDMTRQLEDKWIEYLKSRTSLGYLGIPEDIAEAVAFLASDKAGYITGHVLGISGGMGGI
ncbi:MAG: SDR family oxidoreductase, partial [Dehalococcoidales bacterium]